MPNLWEQNKQDFPRINFFFKKKYPPVDLKNNQYSRFNEYKKTTKKNNFLRQAHSYPIS